jgi:peptidoglycan/LPS O-acetylase OafA/YrhL
MNSTSAFATITVIVLITKYQINKFTYFGVLIFITSLVNLVAAVAGINQFIVESVISILLRYLSDLSYSLFLIYTI